MKNYVLLRFVKLNLYFFVMYSLLTAIWYGIDGRLSSETDASIREIVFNAALFSLMFSLGILIWYWRTTIEVPVKQLDKGNLLLKMEEIGYLPLSTGKKEKVQVFKPAPPKAPAFAGKIFVKRTANAYFIQGPKKYLKKL